LPPDYIVSNWTDELLSLMCDKLSERKQREIEAIKKHSRKSKMGNTQEVSEKELFARGSNLIKVVKKNGD